MDSPLFIYGKHPVGEALERSADRIEKIYVREGIAGIPGILRLASENRILVQHVPGRKLQELVGSVNDQGVVAQMAPVAYLDFEDWIVEIDLTTKPLILVLDEIEDPHNVGAILRTAAAAGAAGVIVPKHRQAPVNATVVKTSAGTAGIVPIVRVVNVNQTLRTLQDAGFWIYGLDQNAKESVWQHTFDTAVALVVGSEGGGIREKTLELCDFRLSLPMENAVESLNASVSAALVMYEWKRQQSK